MRTDEFWAVVDRAAGGQPGADGAAQARAGDATVVAGRATDELAGRGVEVTAAWGRHLDRVMAASYTEDLWAAAYLINGGCSDEGFDAFRGWLVAQGRAVVSGAVREADSLAGLPAVRAAAADGTEFDGSAVLRIADEAHRRVTGAALPPPAEPVVPPDVADFFDFDNEDEMRRRLPRLAALFLEPPEE